MDGTRHNLGPDKDAACDLFHGLMGGQALPTGRFRIEPPPRNQETGSSSEIGDPNGRMGMGRLLKLGKAISVSIPRCW